MVVAQNHTFPLFASEAFDTSGTVFSEEGQLTASHQMKLRQGRLTRKKSASRQVQTAFRTTMREHCQ